MAEPTSDAEEKGKHKSRVARPGSTPRGRDEEQTPPSQLVYRIAPDGLSGTIQVLPSPPNDGPR